MLTKLERLNKYYWNKRDIQTVLGISCKKAIEVFNAVDTLERQQCSFKAHDTKVSQKLVLKITGIDERLKRRQLESEEAQKKSSTVEK